ncbi:uncharacterized protein NPIL_342601 [Nephila pilipes]|uniref:Uncharacterized protein n=1 Tax=Nephila pilipes TaxID=299642 RepID=A0A8X6PXB4_NEPPI|nr:uncharacterized protein NPIL_342601 [Nephila pilipes]
MCSVRCSQHFQLFHCGYVTEKLSMFYRTLPWDPDKITAEQLKCAPRVELKTKSYCKTLCGLPCEDIRFEVAVDGRHLTEEAVLEISRSKQMKDIIQNRWNNLAVVRIYFKTIERKIYEHVPKYSNQELFSHLGGYSGVWLGFSLLNLYELLEIIGATLNFALTKSKAQKLAQSKNVTPPVFYTQSSKKFYEDAIITNSLFFARKNRTLAKLKSKKI